MYEKMYESALRNDSDIVVSGYMSEYDSESVPQPQSLSLTKEQTVSSMLMFSDGIKVRKPCSGKCRQFPGSVVNVLYFFP